MSERTHFVNKEDFTKFIDDILNYFALIENSVSTYSAGRSRKYYVYSLVNLDAFALGKVRS